MQSPYESESSTIFIPADMPGVELLHARFLNQDFPRHFHNRYGVGTLEQGAMEFNFLGRTFLAEAGTVNLTVPGEMHDGHAYTDAGWAYRMFYLDPELVAKAADHAATGHTPLPDFHAGVLHDPELASVIQTTHLLLSNKDAPLIARQTQLLAMLTLWISRHATPGKPLKKPGNEPEAIALARQYMDEHCSEDIHLDDLARLVNLSAFHFVRCFTKALGLPPHAYLMGTRIRQAKLLLKSPMRLADIAQETGFTDQAHFTRVFRRHVGLTPGKYRKAIQN